MRPYKYRTPIIAAYAVALTFAPIASASAQDKRDLEKIERQIEASQKQREALNQAVSYTHLTLPTIYSV